MNTEKINTLAQIHQAQDIIITALAIPSLTPVEIGSLQDASLKLRNMERSIVTFIDEALVNSLTADTADLRDLTEQIKQSTQKLSAVAIGLDKVAGIVEAFINIIATVAAAGL